MIHLAITDAMRSEVDEIIASHGGKHAGGFDAHPDRMRTGYLGEVAFENMFNCNRVNDFNYDFLINGKKVDVKTKHSKNTPEDWHEVSCFPSQKWQKCDYYAFMRISDDNQNAWFVGILPKDKFYTESYLLKKGVKQHNGLIPKFDSYNMTLGKLWEISENDLLGH